MDGDRQTPFALRTPSFWVLLVLCWSWLPVVFAIDLITHTSSSPTRIIGWALLPLDLILTIRVALTHVVVSGSGLERHGPVFVKRWTWADIEKVEVVKDPLAGMMSFLLVTRAGHPKERLGLVSIGSKRNKLQDIASSLRRRARLAG